MAQLSKLKPYAIGAAVLGASIAAGIGVYHLVPGPELGFTFDWPPENGGLSDQNGGGTTVCDPPVDPCPEGSDLDTSDFTGRADPGTTVKLYRNNRATVIGETTAASDGSWTVPGVVIPEGTHTIIAEATRGDKSVTVSHTIYVDTTKPTWSDEWDVPDGIDAEAGIYLHGCGCPDWCWPAETAWTTLESCDPSPGYRCGPAGDCHADYTEEQYEECKASRRAGCLRVSTPQAEDNHQVRLIEVHTSSFAQAGSYKVKKGVSTTRVELHDDPTTAWPPWTLAVGDAVSVAGQANEPTVSAISASAPWYVDVNAPGFDETPYIGAILSRVETPTDAQKAAWWEQTGMPDWAENSQCVIPPNVVDSETGGPATCVPKSEWK